MKIKSAVFVVESPMQLLNAIESKYYFSITNSYLFIRYDGIPSNDSHIDYVLNSIDDDFKVVSRILVPYGKKDLFKMLFPLFRCLRYNPDYLFIGNFYSGYIKLLKFLFPNKKTFYLDDGAQTTRLYHENQRINLFSYFSFPDVFSNRLYIHHNFEYLKSRLREKTPIRLKNTVYIVGAALVENQLLSIEKYELVFNLLLTHYKDYNILYFPHRFENLDKFQRYANVSIMNIDMPIELYLLQSSSLPQVVTSFYSAALYTVNSIFGNVINVEAFKIPCDYFYDSQYGCRVEKLYNYLSQSIRVIELDEAI